MLTTKNEDNHLLFYNTCCHDFKLYVNMYDLQQMVIMWYKSSFKRNVFDDTKRGATQN